MVKLLEESEGQERLILPFMRKANLLLDQGKMEEGLASLSDATSMFFMVQEEPGYAGDFCDYLVEEREQEDNENKTERELGDGPNIAIIGSFINITQEDNENKISRELGDGPNIGIIETFINITQEDNKTRLRERLTMVQT